MIFSKFIPLDYKLEDYTLNNFSLPPENKENKSNNEKFYEIFHYSSLYAATFEKMNDIDECTYSVAMNNIDIRNQKLARLIFCFNFDDTLEKNKELHKKYTRYNFEEDLMWAHYANGCCGVRINFEIPEPYSVSEKDNYKEDTKDKKIIFPVKYDDKLLRVNNQSEAMDKIIEIMTRKKKCWSYEQEYRAIFNKDTQLQYENRNPVPKNRFPIKIEDIILGRKFCTTKFYEPSKENERTFDNHIICIARQIMNVIEETQRKKRLYNKLPRILAYKTMYSEKPF